MIAEPEPIEQAAQRFAAFDDPLPEFALEGVQVDLNGSVFYGKLLVACEQDYLAQVTAGVGFAVEHAQGDGTAEVGIQPGGHVAVMSEESAGGFRDVCGIQEFRLWQGNAAGLPEQAERMQEFGWSRGAVHQV
jgi:hypothetical protein